MMEGHEKAVYKGLTGGEVSMEVGWNSKSGDAVRITIGKEQVVIPYQQLYGFVFLNAEGEQLNDLAPSKHTIVRKFMKQHRVQVQKPIKKGEHLVVNCETDVPVTVIQALKGDIRSLDTKPSAIISPG